MKYLDEFERSLNLIFKYLDVLYSYIYTTIPTSASVFSSMPLWFCLPDQKLSQNTAGELKNVGSLYYLFYHQKQKINYLGSDYTLIGYFID